MSDHLLPLLAASHSPPGSGLEATPLNVEEAVRQRYSAASQAVSADLCCPVDYDAKYLDVLPAEIIERDYGCGDPSRHVRPGETVLDLGSGGGKICYIAAQIVGPRGHVIGVDCNDDMLALARKYRSEVGDRLGFHNVAFHRGRIQDLALDLDEFERYLAEHPVRSAADWQRAESHAEHLRQTRPMIPAASVDVVVSNCVLNLVRRDDRRQLFAEVFRVLRPGGRAVISDIACDEPVPESLQNDAALWSGCISGAFVEHEFLAAFTSAGFHGLRLLERQNEPWATVGGIEFRSVTVEAFKGEPGSNQDQREAVIYRGPWRSVTDDAGQVLGRGARTAVSRGTFERLRQPPYSDFVFLVPPRGGAGDDASTTTPAEIDSRQPTIRDPRETKGPSYQATILPGQNCCGPGCC